MTTRTPGSAPRTVREDGADDAAESAELRAVQAALRAEHAAVYGYGVVVKANSWKFPPYGQVATVRCSSVTSSPSVSDSS
ncbi:hypothetical protein ABT334_29780, partial [Streptomyces albidoflavus]